MDFDDDGVARRISARLKIALVADLVTGARTTEAGNQVFREPNDLPRDWTSHLARQLRFPDSRYLGADLHDTLLVAVGELDRLLRTPALLSDRSEPATIAHEAVKHITTREGLTMLLMGPESWLRGDIPACKVENLAKHLQPIVERGLASSIGSLLGRWQKWDVVGLRDRWGDAFRTDQAVSRPRAGVPRSTPARRPKRIPPPPPLTPEQRAEAQASAQRNKGKVLGHYEPPWESAR